VKVIFVLGIDTTYAATYELAGLSFIRSKACIDFRARGGLPNKL
jgi:hypothetical protein